MKTVYLYDEKTGEFAGSYNAQPSPLFDPKEHPAHESHIVPVHSTEIAPPPTRENEVAVFTEGAWKIETDYRGQYAYDQASGEGKKITDIGALPLGFTLTPPPPTVAEQALQALHKATGASGTVMRCMVAGIALPAEWRAYIVALRALVNEPRNSTKALPIQPAYPAEA